MGIVAAGAAAVCGEHPGDLFLGTLMELEDSVPPAAPAAVLLQAACPVWQLCQHGYYEISA